MNKRQGRIEVEPIPREVRIVKEGSLHVANPVATSAPLREAEVKSTRRSLRERRG
jgi:hypothetical protein